MFFRAKSTEELRELKEKLVRDRSALKTRIRLEGGPMNGTEVELSPPQIEQGLMAVCHTVNRKRVDGAYRPSDLSGIWRYTSH